MAEDVESRQVDDAEDPAEIFWAACARRELWLQLCRDCEQWQYYPRAVCSHCWSQNLLWKQPSGRAVLETFSVVRRGSGSFAAVSPYVVALVKLAEGPRMMTNVDTRDPARLVIGMPLQVGFRQQNGRTVPIFREL